MKRLILICIGLGMVSCATNDNKAVSIDTNMKNDQVVSGDTSIGVKNGDLVVQRKVVIAEHLRDLQIQVYYLEDEVYGNEKTGNRGLYGVLKDCKMKLADKANGGDGKLTFIEPLDRVTEKEESLKLGLDERDNLVGISEEFLKDRITRFNGYRSTLTKRKDDISQKLDMCTLESKTRAYDMQAAAESH